MLINAALFVSPLCDIAGLSNPDVKARVESFIDEYEPQFLSGVLGPVYDDFTAGLLAEEVEAIWTALGDKLKKACVLYVAYWYLRSGQQKIESDADKKQNLNEMVRAWNGMVKEVRSLYAYLDANATTYGSWVSSYQRGSFVPFSGWQGNEFVRPINSMNI